MCGTRSGFVVDANVLIDFESADLAILGVFAKKVGPVFVPNAVIENVSAVSLGDCDRIGLRLIQPNLDQLIEAGENRGRLAFDDWLCLILARDHAYQCISNDKALRAECINCGVSVMWGLEPMLILAAQGELSCDEAESVAWKIHESNPVFVTESIISAFMNKLRGS